MAGDDARPDSPCSGCSTFTTSAPNRASICVAYGNACICSAASTRTPSSGLPNPCAPAFATSPSCTATLYGRVSGGSRLGSNGGTPRRLRAMRGIISAAGYVPFRRLDRGDIAKTFGSGGGKGTRSVASYDEDTTTMAVEAARLVRRSAPDTAAPGALWFSTANPAYLDKNNASAIHAALRLDTQVGALDFGGALRSGVGALRTALDGNGCVMVIASDLREGLPTSGDESQGGDGAAAIVVGSDQDGPVIAEYLGGASATEEFIERWRAPGSHRSRAWEERFGEVKYAPLAEQAWNAALKSAELAPDQVDKLIVTGMHARAVRAIGGRLGASKAATAEDLAATVGNTGTAHPALLLTNAIESAEPGQVV